MNNYLHAFPFHIGESQMSDCKCPGQGFDPPSFKLYSTEDSLPTFVLRLPPLGASPDLTYANECLRIFSCDGGEVASITMEEAGVKLYKDAASYYVVYDGRVIPTMKLECGKCFRIRISSFWSETFWITATPTEKIRFEFTNRYQLGDVPYQAEFKQILLIDGALCSMDAELFENRKSDNNGKETITYQRLTSRKGVEIFGAPDFIQQLFGAAKLHDGFKVVANNETLDVLKKRVDAEFSQNGCCDYDIKLTLPLRDIDIIGGYCQSDTSGVLQEVEIPDDLPDSCELDGDWVATDETLCLRDNQFPPPIQPPITPVGTPPVGTPCPPAGQVVSSNTVSVNCDVAFEHEGVKYKKKVTKQIADGSCGTTEQISYLEPCSGVYTHQISNVNCEGDVIPTPPVGTPPVGTPPVGTPPVGTPPVGTPPVGTPPPASYAQKYRILMGTTGSGFDPAAEHGIQPEWTSRIDACHYSWGWGISGVCLWMSWEGYEPTPGNFQSAALIRAINFCNARGLELCIVWIPKRKEGDGFINPSEYVKGSMGTVYYEGVPGFGSVFAGWGCDRVNNLMVPAIKSVANTLKTYSRAFYMSLSGAHSGEFNNHMIITGSQWEAGDFSDDNLARFNTFVTSRGLATPGTPPMIQGPGIQWPHPDFNDARGLEFARFQTYNLAKAYKNFCLAVKSVAPNMPCIMMYAAASNQQLRGTANAALNYIGQWGDGMYGSDGDALYDHIAKIRCNSVNLGTYPNGISGVEFDPDDLSTYRYTYGTTPPYCQANPQWQVFKTSAETLFSKGTMIVHWAMAYCEAELSSEACSQALQQLSQLYVGKPYVRPTLNSNNVVNCEVTEPYRASQDILEYYGVDVNAKYAKYTSNNYWGGIDPGL